MSGGQATNSNQFLSRANHMRQSQLNALMDNSGSQSQSALLNPTASDANLKVNHEKESLLTEIAKIVAHDSKDGKLECSSSSSANDLQRANFSVNAKLIQTTKTEDELSNLGVDAYNQNEFENEAIQQFEKQVNYQQFLKSKIDLEAVEKKIFSLKKQIEEVEVLIRKANQSKLFEVQKKRNDLIKKQADLEMKLEDVNKDAERLKDEIDSFVNSGGKNSLNSQETERERLIRIGEITPFEATPELAANTLSQNVQPVKIDIYPNRLLAKTNHSISPKIIEKHSRWKKEEEKGSKRSEEESGSEYSEYETDEELGYISSDDNSVTRKQVGDWNDSDYLTRVSDSSFDVTKRENFEEVCGLRVPKVIYEQLFKYQKTGLRWLTNLHTNGTGGILGDEMGLGKTIQMISFLAGLKYSSITDYTVGSFKGLGPVIIVCPATLVKQWVAELNKWWPPFRVAALTSDCESSKQTKVVSKIISTNGVLVCSYSIVRILEQNIVHKNWHYVILDEGHQIRNPDAKITLTCKNFKTNHRIILSGSPIQNNLKELWSIFDFIYPGKLGTLPAFQEHFAVPITQGGYTNANSVQVQTAYKCACVLRDTISPFLLRRVKDDVKSSLTLPKKSEQILFCKLSDEQRMLYKGYIDKIDLRTIGNFKGMLFTSLTNLRKICNHPRIFEAIGKEVSMSEIGDDGHWKESGKMIVVESLLRLWKRQNHRVLIFTQSVQMLRIFEQFLIHFDYRFLKMEGKTTISSRQPMITQFNSDPSIFVFLLTTKTGGLGVNLVGADRVLIYDPDWNPGTDMQARERAWRIGQDKDVLIYRLVCTGTIEEKIYHRQIFKLFLTNRILKDPKQRRFFKSHDLYDLFTLGDDDSNEKGTETSSIFAGIGADIVKREENEGKTTSKVSRKTQFTQPVPLASVPVHKLVKPTSPVKKVAVKREDPKSEKKRRKREKKAVRGAIRDMMSKWGVSTESEMGKRMVRRLKKSQTLQNAVKDRAGKIDGAKIHGLDKVKRMKRKSAEQEEVDDDGKKNRGGDKEEQEQQETDYILGKLFSGGGIQGAIQHDVIEDRGQGPDYWLVEEEAEKVAQEAVAKLKSSQQLCQTALDGVPNWTGRHGFIRRDSGGGGAKKFGSKASFMRSSNMNSSSSDAQCSNSSGNGLNGLSSAEMLKNLKLKKIEGATATTSSANPFSSEQSKTRNDVIIDEKVLEEIVTYIKFHSENPGEATSEELIDQFKSQVGEGNNAIFRAMLTQVCEKTQSFTGAVVWNLKPEFSARLSET